MGVVCNFVNIKSKLDNQGITCMFLDYVKKYMGGTYHMLNLRTKRTGQIRYVIWLNKTYGDYQEKKLPR